MNDPTDRWSNPRSSPPPPPPSTSGASPAKPRPEPDGEDARLARGEWAARHVERLEDGIGEPAQIGPGGVVARSPTGLFLLLDLRDRAVDARFTAIETKIDMVAVKFDAFLATTAAEKAAIIATDRQAAKEEAKKRRPREKIAWLVIGVIITLFVGGLGKNAIDWLLTLHH